jgi:transposase-like protein
VCEHTFVNANGRGWTVEELEEAVARQVREHGFLATGRRYGVSGNAIRKWIRWYEREREATGAVSAESAQRPPASTISR